VIQKDLEQIAPSSTGFGHETHWTMAEISHEIHRTMVEISHQIHRRWWKLAYI
jgi:hypothetical protein